MHYDRGAFLLQPLTAFTFYWYTHVSYTRHTHTHPFNGPFSGTTQVSWYQKVKPIWISLKQETVSGSGISWAICKSALPSRQITTPAPHCSFYRSDALPATQPTVSKHWRPVSYTRNNQFMVCGVRLFVNADSTLRMHVVWVDVVVLSLIFLWFTLFSLVEVAACDFHTAKLIDVMRCFTLYGFYVAVRPARMLICILAEYTAALTLWIFEIISVLMDSLHLDSFQRRSAALFLFYKVLFTTRAEMYFGGHSYIT